MGERGGCRVRRKYTVLRQNAAAAQLFPISYVARHRSALAFKILTYISIGFFDDIIYAAHNVGVDHNMLLIHRIWGQGRHRPLIGGGVLPNIAPFVLSPQSVGIMAPASVETARDGSRD